jgi:hypothetical protein
MLLSDRSGDSKIKINIGTIRMKLEQQIQSNNMGRKTAKFVEDSLDDQDKPPLKR